jgi:hypothetical protein
MSATRTAGRLIGHGRVSGLFPFPLFATLLVDGMPGGLASQLLGHFAV